MTSFFQGLKELADVFNVGRVVFYPSSAFLPAASVVIVIGQLRAALHPTFGSQLAHDVKFVGDHLLATISLAIVLGFLLATWAFTTTITCLQTEVRRDPGPPIHKFSYHRLYPLLSSAKADSSAKGYDTWLMAEFYRFVEIATLIPLGLLISIPIFGTYVFVFLMRDAFRSPQEHGFTSAHWALVLLVVGGLMVWQIAWPGWLERVVKPSIQCWERAKRGIVEGIESLPPKGKEPTP